MQNNVSVLICTPVYRDGSYILDKFLENQKEIQGNYPLSRLVLATNENDFIDELNELLEYHRLRGNVILYEVEKPKYAKNKVWNVARGREALRRYMLSYTNASYMLCLDADMTYDPNVINILVKEIPGYSLVHSGAALREFGIALSGSSCTMLTRNVLERIEFRCCEFKNGSVIPEDLMIEMDMFRLRCNTKRGFFVSSCHYLNESEAKCITAGPVSILRRQANNPFFRYVLIRTSILLGYNIPWALKVLVNRLMRITW